MIKTFKIVIFFIKESESLQDSEYSENGKFLKSSKEDSPKYSRNSEVAAYRESNRVSLQTARSSHRQHNDNVNYDFKTKKNYN